VRRERCPECGHTAMVYARLVEPRCANPWHGVVGSQDLTHEKGQS
jgi:hypothetical protein